MTDTAVPLPDLIDSDAPADGAILRPSQLRRVEALHQARQVLESKAALFVGSNMPEVRSVGDLTYLAEWILFGAVQDDDEDKLLSLEASRDASNKAYFDSGWETVRREVLAVDEQMGSQPAVDWIREHPAGSRLIDGPDKLPAGLEHVATFHPRPVADDTDDSKSYPEDALPK